jgi:Flp pilus assembly pilin Flp
MLIQLSLAEGQELVEYALVVAVVVFAATAGMRVLASALSRMFTQLITLGMYDVI